MIKPRYIETNFARSIANLPVRYLPPGTISMLWWEMKETTGSNVSWLGSNVDRILESKVLDNLQCGSKVANLLN